MSENLSLFLFLLLIYSYFQEKKSHKYITGGISLIGLLLTKFSLIGIVLGGLSIFFLGYFEKKSSRKILFFFLLSFLIIYSFDFFLRKLNINGFNVIYSLFSNEDPFFGIRFVWNNCVEYLKMIFFSKGLFLWLNIGITNFIFLSLYFLSISLLWIKKERKKSLILLILFIVQFPMQLIFYLADARYIIYTIPLISLGIGWLIELHPQKRTFFTSIIIIGVILQLFLQKNLVREIIGNNLLGKSTAWQYEAIKQFDSSLNDDDLIITALPPFLVDAYQAKKYRFLPLSNDQEFINKKQYIWGNDINYEDLFQTYKQWMSEGKLIYISNSYITHSAEVIQDYEKFKSYFKFEYFREGCNNSCDIFILRNKED